MSFLLLLLLAGDPAPKDAPAKDNEGFEKLDGSMMAKRGEFIPADRLVGGAYGFILVALVGYVVSVDRRNRRIAEEMAELQHKLEGK